VAHQDFRNRFKIVKVETTEPLKRGRWTCFDFVDKPAAKEKIAAATTSAEAGDKKAAGTGNIPAAVAKVVTSRPASSMARELGAVHETTAVADEGVRHVDAGTTQQQQQQQRQTVVGNVTVGGGGGGGVNFGNANAAGGGGGFVAGPPLMTSGGTVQQQLQQQQQQQPQASPPVTSLPQVWRMFF
jgi:hypothetical protein